MKKTIVKNLLYPLLAFAGVIAVWCVAAFLADAKYVLPYPDTVLKELSAVIRSRYFVQAVWGTLLRSLKGFAVSAAAAAVLAFIGARINPLHRFLSPFITIVRSVPTMSIILFALMWISADKSPAVIAGLIIFPLMYSNFYFAIKNTDTEILQMSTVYKVKKSHTLLKVYLPSVAPAFFDTLRASISLNLKVVIASEVLAQTRFSIGVMLQSANYMLNTAELLAWTVVAVAMSFVLEGIISLIKYMVVVWER